MLRNKQTSQKSIVPKCIYCKRKIKKFTDVLMLGSNNAFIHKHCLLKQIEKNQYKDAIFYITFLFYIEDRAPKREIYICGNKLFSNRESYLRYGKEEKSIILSTKGSILGNDILLQGKAMVPYNVAKKIYEGDNKRFLIYLAATKCRLLSPIQLHAFYTNKLIIENILNSNASFFISFPFIKDPPKYVKYWLNSFCDHQKNIYFTSSHSMSGILTSDHDIRIIGNSQSDINEEQLRENLIKSLSGEKVKVYDYSMETMKKAFKSMSQSKQKKEDKK